LAGIGCATFAGGAATGFKFSATGCGCDLFDQAMYTITAASTNPKHTLVLFVTDFVTHAPRFASSSVKG
jgi:hypothetical protein